MARDGAKPPAGVSGRLIAVEGTRGVDVAEAARRVLEALDARAVEAGVSRFDASGTFFDVAQVKKSDFRLSPRTLLLLYAADLQFRLRWEITPILAEGRTVIVAPYTATARAFGQAVGIGAQWLDALFAGVPAADVSLRAKERKVPAGWKRSVAQGFGEACAVALAAAQSRLDSVAVRGRMVTALDTLEARGRLDRVRKKRLRKLARSFDKRRSPAPAQQPPDAGRTNSG